MSLTDHLHQKSDPIRAFLDEKLVDFGPAKEKWKVAQSGSPLAEDADSWSLVGTAIDMRIRMIFAHINFEISPQGLRSHLVTTFPSVSSELDEVQSRHGGPLCNLSANEDKHVLQVCYVMAMYLSLARSSGGSWWTSPLRTLKPGAKWRAHLNRVTEQDIGVLQTLVKPALEVFSLFVDRKVDVSPVFADSLLVDGADGDLVIDNNLIEIKCETPGFRAVTVRQALAYCLLDSTDEYELTRCSIYLARFGTMASWNLDQLIREISLGRYGYDSLRVEFHDWLVARRAAEESIPQREREKVEEGRRRFPEEWKDLTLATEVLRKTSLLDRESYDVALSHWAQAKGRLRRLESELGMGGVPLDGITPIKE